MPVPFQRFCHSLSVPPAGGFLIAANPTDGHILIVHFRLCRIPELSSLYGVGLFALCTAGTPAVFAAEIREKRSFRKTRPPPNQFRVRGWPYADRTENQMFIPNETINLQVLSRYNLIANKKRPFDRFFLRKIQLNRK